MIRHVRLTILMARPAVLVLLALYTATGLAQAGHADDQVGLLKALVVVAAFLMFSVACNDLADQAIDRVNLTGDRRRPLVTGTASRLEFVVAAMVSAGVALTASALLGWSAVLVAAAGLALSAAYSLRPTRLADRGAVASLLLPACYVAVPYLVGIVAGRGVVRGGDLPLLAGLYVGFIGRILLKDFRDVRGDALFGKRTFLVRHGRRRTCLFSAGCWTVGAATLLATVQRPTATLVVTQVVLLTATLWLLRALSNARGARRDEWLIAALAIIGRGTILTLLAHLSMVQAQVPLATYGVVLVTLAGLTAGQAVAMVRSGPVVRHTAAALAPAPAGTVRPAAAGQARHSPRFQFGDQPLRRHQPVRRVDQLSDLGPVDIGVGKVDRAATVRAVVGGYEESVVLLDGRQIDRVGLKDERARDVAMLAGTQLLRAPERGEDLAGPKGWPAVGDPLLHARQRQADLSQAREPRVVVAEHHRVRHDGSQACGGDGKKLRCGGSLASRPPNT